MRSIHRTVLLNETIDGLGLKADARGTVLDATFGGGGHSEEICRRYPKMRIIALDEDEGALARARAGPGRPDCRIDFINENFRDLDKAVEGAVLDGIIFDLGLSSDQLENSGRGFSFLKDEPLLMTMKARPEEADLTAEEIVNTWEEKNLADIIYGYGEERYARRIAKAIAEARKEKKIQTTGELAAIIASAMPGGYRRSRAKGRAGKIHPATRTFQAIRITVNDELSALREGLQKGFQALKGGGRMAVISFHSLEDRIVKNFFRNLAKEGRGKIINKKPITAGKEEVKNNARARSAKLRILEKIK